VNEVSAEPLLTGRKHFLQKQRRFAVQLDC